MRKGKYAGADKRKRKICVWHELSKDNMMAEMMSSSACSAMTAGSEVTYTIMTGTVQSSYKRDKKKTRMKTITNVVVTVL